MTAHYVKGKVESNSEKSYLSNTSQRMRNVQYNTSMY